MSLTFVTAWKVIKERNVPLVSCNFQKLLKLKLQFALSNNNNNMYMWMKQNVVIKTEALPTVE